MTESVGIDESQQILINLVDTSILSKQKSGNIAGEKRNTIPKKKVRFGSKFDDIQRKHQSVFSQQGFSSNIWKQGSLKIVFFVSRFSQLLLSSINKIKLNFVNHKHFNIIGDKAASYEYYRSRGMVNDELTFWDKLDMRFGQYAIPMKKCWSILKRNLELFNIVLMPDNSIKMIFDVMFMLLVIVDVFYESYLFGFQSYDSETDIFQRTLLAFFLADIIVTFNTAYYSRGRIVSNRKQIFRHYVRGHFGVDALLSVTPILSSFISPKLSGLIILRYLKIQTILDNIELIYNLRERFSVPLQLLKLIFLMMLSCHLIACGWCFVGLYEEQTMNVNSWLSTKDMYINLPQVEIYLAALYFAVITTCTVGYGDITATTNLERVYVIVVILLASVLFGYMISSIGSIIGQYKEQNEKYLNKISIINTYIKKLGLSQKLQLKVRLYFEYFLRQSENDTIGAELILNLPEQLGREVKIERFYNYLANVKFIKKCFADSVIEQLCIEAEERIIRPQETVIQSHQTIDSIYIVTQGEIITYVEKGEGQQISLRKYKKGAILFQYNFLSQDPVPASAKAVKHTKIIQINRQTLEAVLKQFSVENEQKYQQCCSNIVFNPEQKTLQPKCEICKKVHYTMKCYLTFYSANRRKIIRNLLRVVEQHRQSHKRKLRAHYDPRQNRHAQIECAVNVILNNQIQPVEDIDEELLERFGYKRSKSKTKIEIERKPQDFQINQLTDSDGHWPNSADISNRSNLNHNTPQQMQFKHSNFSCTLETQDLYVTFKQDTNTEIITSTATLSTYNRINKRRQAYTKAPQISNLLDLVNQAKQTSSTPKLLIKEEIYDDSSQSSETLSQADVALVKKEKFGLTFDYLDRAFEYKYFYPKFNIRSVINKINGNQRRMNQRVLSQNINGKKMNRTY